MSWELSDYEKKRLERIKKNEEHLKKLGLDKFTLGPAEKSAKRKKSQSKTAKKRTKITPAAARRKSSRLSSSPPSQTETHPVTPEDDTELECVTGARGAYTYRRPRKIHIEKSWKLLKEEKDILAQGINENFLSKFQAFLQYHDKISEQNLRNVMKQVRKLAAGNGIRYESPRYGWPEGCYFRRGEKITPLSDIVELMEEAQDCEDRWGRDHGNGWLLSHPLKKLLLFQQFALKNPSFLGGGGGTSGGKSEEDDDNEDDRVAVVEVVPLEADTDTDTDTETNTGTKDRCLIGTKVSKKFGNEVFLGTIDKFDGNEMLWHVTYEDGDEEEFDEDDMKNAKFFNDQLNF